MIAWPLNGMIKKTVARTKLSVQEKQQSDTLKQKLTVIL